MLITYNNYIKLREAIRSKVKTYKEYGSKTAYIKLLIANSIISAEHRNQVKAKLDDELLFDYIIFLHYYRNFNVSFETINGDKFKLDVNCNRKLLWKLFKKQMDL